MRYQLTAYNHNMCAYLWTLVCRQFKVCFFFWGGGGGRGGGKKCKKHFFGKHPFLTKCSTSSLRAREQRGVPDWKKKKKEKQQQKTNKQKTTLKKLKFRRKQNLYEFIKNRIFPKSNYRFENRTMRQAETKVCLFLDMDHKAIPGKSKFSPFCNQKCLPILHTSGLNTKKKK